MSEKCVTCVLHREELKKRIDDIALEMIDKIKKHEEAYLKSLITLNYVMFILCCFESI